MKYQPYRFPNDINYKHFFKFKKDMITAPNSLWRALSLSSKSVYPVIGCHCNAEGKAFPSQQTIGDLAGLTRKTVREGVEGLMALPWFTISNKINAKGMRTKMYVIDQDKTLMFPFHKSILESGIWRELSTGNNSKSAHAVYCVCRAYGFQDVDLFNETEKTDHGEDDFWTDVYPYRDFDFLEAHLDVIAEKAGVSINTAQKAMNALMELWLLEFDELAYCYRILFTPKKYFKREYLNSELEKTQERPGKMHWSRQDENQKLPTKKVET